MGMRRPSKIQSEIIINFIIIYLMPVQVISFLLPAVQTLFEHFQRGIWVSRLVVPISIISNVSGLVVFPYKAHYLYLMKLQIFGLFMAAAAHLYIYHIYTLYVHIQPYIL